ncbi:hypothetical protein [Nocardia sp. NPDC024068]|uniref:hypothetical protein n=1 Tax=Nocardia sp. NPDC024068 TaxID=3157197 RepID=UPI0033CFF477
MYGQPPLLQAGPGPVFEAGAILNGTVDMRTYQRRYLVVCSEPTRKSGWDSSLRDADHRGTLSALTLCIEWLDENFGWEPVSVFTRHVDTFYYIHHALLRRRKT